MNIVQQFWKKISLNTLIIFTVLSIMIIQAVIVCSSIFNFDIATKLDQSNVQSLYNTVSYEGNYLSNEFSRFSNLEDYYNSITSKVYSVVGSNSPSEYFNDAQNRSDFLSSIVPILTGTLRGQDTTAIFIILNGDSKDPYKDAVYIRDYNPHNNYLDNSDFYLEAGPYSISNQYNITIDNLWSSTLDTSSNCEFFNTIIEATNNNPNKSAMSLGYFSLPLEIHENDYSIISYSIPLLDANHECYGIIGYGMTLDYFSNYLHSSELSSIGDGSYMVAIYNNNTLSPIVVDNADFFNDLNLSAFSTIPKMRDYNLFNLYNDGIKTDLISCICDLPFTNDSVYPKNNWVICGIVQNDNIFFSGKYINSILMVFIICSAVIAFIASFFLVHFITDPIKELLRGVKDLSPNSISLPVTNIKEYDELANTIVAGNKKLFSSSKKITDILESANISLGVIELHEEDDVAFCTKAVFDILSLNSEGWHENFISKHLIVSQLQKRRECFRQSHDDPEIYLYRCPNLEDKWLHISNNKKYNSYIITFQDVTKEQETKEELLRERDYDSLTNLYNRGAFAREMKRLIDNGSITNGILSIWDLDNLKFANDTYGHDVGDKYICVLGEILTKEPSVNSVCARLAGDEFTLFLYGESNDLLLQEIKNIHKKLLSEKLILPNEQYINISASAGVSYYPEDGNCYKDLLKFADYAMYQIKHSSKGQVKKFNRESYIHDYILVNGIGELERIISEQAIKYSFQPIFSMETNKIFAYEALIRPVSDLLSSPDNLLKVAQKESKLGSIEKLTWFLALRNFYNQVKPEDNAKLFINSLPDQLLSPEDFVSLEEEFGSNLSRVVMEITESNQSEATVDQEKRNFCRKWHIPVALDDFGSGYSNSDILVTKPFNFIKIDRSLIHSIDVSPSKQVFVSGIINYCHENDQLVIAEGIETQSEYDIMKKMGADYAQGYFLKKPNGNLY